MKGNMANQPQLMDIDPEEHLSEEELAKKGEYRQRLAEKLKDPEFRKIEGFPIGEDEAILALSDPSDFTVCPNPFISDFINSYGKSYNLQEDTYKRQPFTGDISTIQRNPVYSAHTYHTKVPPDIISTLLAHYCEPDDLVLDVFSGTGMTGVATAEQGLNCILIDLSTIAGFVSWVNTSKFPYKETLIMLNQIIDEVEEEFSYLYQTRDEKGNPGVLNYAVWSDVFACPDCNFEFPFFPHGVEHLNKKVKTRKSFPCPNCKVELNIRSVNRVITIENKKKKELVWINAKTGNRNQDREPTTFDLELAEKIETKKNPYWYPEDKINSDWYTARLAQLGQKRIDSVDDFLSRRNLIVFSALFDRVKQIKNTKVKAFCIYSLTGVFTVISERQGYFGGGGGMSGNLYMPIIRKEQNVFSCLRRRLGKVKKAEEYKYSYTGKTITSVQSSTDLSRIPNNSIDYIYTDPPFGANIIYSEMNSILESWLDIKTNNLREAVINDFQDKETYEYHKLMYLSFRELYRVLKPGRWITVEFHNTQATIWNVIQESLGKAGFIVAQTGTLDKGSSTILQDIRPGAVNNDIIISAYKPKEIFINEFHTIAGSAEGTWSFIRNHLDQLPITIEINYSFDLITERQPRILFDRMVSFHIQNGATIPLSASEFYLGLSQRFSERDGMYFLPEQTPAYDKARIKYSEISQLTLFVIDEKSSIEWLKRILDPKLGGESKPYNDILPNFLRQLHQAQHEVLPELEEILEQNFLIDENENWYVPDPNKQIDLERLRKRSLLREFSEYLKSSGSLDHFRSEAVRAGFETSWQKRDFKTIVKIAKRLPENILQEDPDLLMYYDNASLRVD
jgi:DNA modification methylase